jgi:hypothetical protein
LSKQLFGLGFAGVLELQVKTPATALRGNSGFSTTPKAENQQALLTQRLLYYRLLYFGNAGDNTPHWRKHFV